MREGCSVRLPGLCARPSTPPLPPSQLPALPLRVVVVTLFPLALLESWADGMAFTGFGAGAGEPPPDVGADSETDKEELESDIDSDRGS